MSQDTIKPDNNMVAWEEGITVEDAANTESPAEYAARMKELAGRFDLPQEAPKPESSWQNITNMDGDLVGTTADGTKVVFASDHGDLIIRYPDGRSENRTATVEEVEKMFGITMSKMKNNTELPAQKEEVKESKKESSETGHENHKKCSSCGNLNPLDSNYCGKCRTPFPPESIVQRIDVEAQRRNEEYQRIEEGIKMRHLENARRVEGVTSFDELYKVLGSFERYDLRRLYEDFDFHRDYRQMIETSRDSFVTRDKLPVDYGIRKKVFELYAEEDNKRFAKISNQSPVINEEDVRPSESDVEVSDSNIENTKKVEGVNSFDELFNIMDSFGEFIPRSNGQKVWTVNVKNAINKYRDGSVPVDVKDILDNLGNPGDALKGITSTFGLRKKAYELMKKEGSGVILKKDGSFKKGL